MKISAIPNFTPQILTDDKITKAINSLYSKQREALHGLQVIMSYDERDVEPVQIFPSEAG